MHDVRSMSALKAFGGTSNSTMFGKLRSLAREVRSVLRRISLQSFFSLHRNLFYVD